MKTTQYAFWIMLLCLGMQSLLSVNRSVLLRSQRRIRQNKKTTHDDITDISVALDIASLIIQGGYFTAGLQLFAQLEALEAQHFAEAFRWLQPLSYLVFLLALSWLSLSLGSLLPETLGVSFAAQWRSGLKKTARALYTVMRPLSTSAVTLSNALARMFGGHALRRTTVITEETIKSLVTVGEHQGVLKKDEREMIYSIFELGETIAREVMIPRTDIVALDQKTAPEEILQVTLESGHSRLPVYDGSIDHIVGVLHVKDLLQFQNPNPKAAPFSLAAILRPVYVVPESKRLDTLLREMRHKRIHMAIVIDEYGSVSGLATLEDIIEEIIGEIQDEYDHEEPESIKLTNGSYQFDARIALDDVQVILAQPFPLEKTDSLGGFIYNQLGHIPTPGESLTFDNVTFEVLDVQDRRILKVRATKMLTPIDKGIEKTDEQNKN